ncbi:MAG: hypothetical protein LBF83_09575, partial [Spirochaetaceae bacterium]|nr:hypothetical protein [Spirochaetaceae bacterium]
MASAKRLPHSLPKPSAPVYCYYKLPSGIKKERVMPTIKNVPKKGARVYARKKAKKVTLDDV